jgi:hypothetical protein
LLALRPDSAIAWTFNLGGGAGSPTLGPDGMLYVSAADGSLWAIPTPSRGLASSSWPMFHRDVRHTGRWTAPSLTSIFAMLLLD